MTARIRTAIARAPIRLVGLVGLAAFFAYQLVLANLRLAADVLRPRPRMRPGIVAVPLEPQTDFQLALLSNLVTLTPGTMTLDVTPDRRILYVHALFVSSPDALVREIKNGFERRVLSLLR